MRQGSYESQKSSDTRLERSVTPFIREAIKRARYWRDTKGIHPEKMSADFGAAAVAKDEADVAKRMQEIAASDSPEAKEEALISEVFEVSLWWLVQNRKFFGEKTRARLPARHDHFVNSTDLILEITGKVAEEVTRLGVGIDATYGTKNVEHKLTRLEDDVLHGKGGEIKYFVSSDNKERRKLTNVPHLIVGLSVARARELAQLWVRSEANEATAYPPEAHPLRVLLLQQVITQASGLAEFARRSGNVELADRYAAAHAHLKPAFDEAMASYLKAAASSKSKLWKDVLDQDYRHDPVHRAILSRAESWKKSAATH